MQSIKKGFVLCMLRGNQHNGVVRRQCVLGVSLLKIISARSYDGVLTGLAQ